MSQACTRPRGFRPAGAALGLGLALAACGMLSGAPQPAARLGPDARLRVAEAAEAAGNGDLAATMYLQAAAAAPDDGALQLRCADALARLGRADAAQGLLQRRQAAAPQDADVQRALARLALQAGQTSAALDGLDAVLARHPDDVGALVDKAVALDLMHRHGAAQALYRRALASAPADPATLNDLALSLLLDGRGAEALAVLAPLRDAADLPERARATLGLLYALNGNRGAARQLVGADIPGEYLMALSRTAARP